MALREIDLTDKVSLFEWAKMPGQPHLRELQGLLDGYLGIHKAGLLAGLITERKSSIHSFGNTDSISEINRNCHEHGGHSKDTGMLPDGLGFVLRRIGRTEISRRYQAAIGTLLRTSPR